MERDRITLVEKTEEEDTANLPLMGTSSGAAAAMKKNSSHETKWSEMRKSDSWLASAASEAVGLVLVVMQHCSASGSSSIFMLYLCYAISRRSS